MESNQNKSVLIIAVIYNAWKDTIRFAESISRCFDHHADLILVDNSEDSPDAVFLDKIKEHDFITYIRSEKNLGYFQGARLGLEYRLKNDPVIPGWVIVCNVDIIFDTLQFHEKLNSFENDPEVGVIAPAVISDRWNTDYNPFRKERIPLRQLRFYRVIYSNFLIHNGYILLHYLKKFVQAARNRVFRKRINNAGGSSNIYAPHGSCIILHKNYFEKGGTLNHQTFLFGEEIFIGETAVRLELKVIYNPKLRIRHHEHSSIGNFISCRINRFYKQSIEDMIKNYYQ